jgi:bifunctional DNA-binding transcriptional regulator/antitoxin component of YhaV-PrlF toxin-antitoxin module
MNARVTITPEGQIAIPDDVLRRLAWTPGMALDIVEGGAGVTLSKPLSTDKQDFASALAKLRAAANWTGPRYDDADWKAAIEAKLGSGHQSIFPCWRRS